MATRRLTMADVKYRAKAAGSYYFDKGNSKFFGGDKFYGPYVGPGGTYFVCHNRAGWTIRQVLADGHISPSIRYDFSPGYQGENVRSHAQDLARGQ